MMSKISEQVNDWELVGQEEICRKYEQGTRRKNKKWAPNTQYFGRIGLVGCQLLLFRRVQGSKGIQASQGF